MYLKSLTLKGFKSFASATTLKFEQGICAVVGPNGSGKSNVVDALTWVMGEQGVKNLRGGKMEDVIFAGTGSRKPLGRAEVTLTIDNSDGALPIEYSEVSITRRMYRDGASEYEINGARARLLDVQELLSDSGIGREMHVIVGQGKLAEILESRPEERRAYIEEAAGVLKYRRRKEKAQRKLLNMQANVDRLQDLTQELGKQLKPLARQAEAAQRAQDVQTTVRDSRLRLAADTILSLRRTLTDAQARTQELRSNLDGSQQEWDNAQADMAAAEGVIEQLAPRVEAAQQLWFGLASLKERVSATRRIAAERSRSIDTSATYQGPDPDALDTQAAHADEQYSKAEAKLAQLQEKAQVIHEELRVRENRAQDAEREHMAQLRAIADRRAGVVRLVAAEESQSQQMASATSEIERLTDFLSQSAQRLKDAEAEQQAIKERRHQLHVHREILAERCDQATTESQRLEERLIQLRNQQRQWDKTVSSLSTRIETLARTIPPTPPILSAEWRSLATAVKPHPGYDRALSAALNEIAEGLTGGDLTDSSVLDELAASKRTVLVGQAWGSAQWRLESSLSVDWLLDHIDSEESVSGAITRFLVDVAVVDTVEEGRAVIQEDPRLRAVTREGALLGDGWIALGTRGQSAVEVVADIETTKTQLETAQVELENLSGALAGAETAAQEARVGAAEQRAALRDLDSQVQGLERDYQRASRQGEDLRREHERAADQVRKAETRLVALQAELELTRDRLARVKDQSSQDEEPSTQLRDEAAQALAAIRAKDVEMKLELRSAEEEVQRRSGVGDRLRRQAQQERVQRDRHEREMARRHAEVELARAVEQRAGELAERVQNAAQQAEEQRDHLTSEHRAAVARRASIQDTVAALRSQRDKLQEQFHQVELEESQALVRLEQTEKQLSDRLTIPVSDILAYFTPGEDFDRSGEEQRLHQAERDLAALGKVNPLALEEYKALEERYSFLSSQLADVNAAREDLQGVIRDVDKRILQLFTDAWHDVEEKFPEVFSTLFPGGEGRLVLTEPADMLATGIEVEARPPGKKVKRLSLLSGGEKSLTALALLVAIFKARPSPFYVMDEVEAALDDVNLRRLIALFQELRKDSQLIVITHQKPTMSIANVLYGVSMRGDGVTRVISQRMAPGD